MVIVPINIMFMVMMMGVVVFVVMVIVMSVVVIAMAMINMTFRVHVSLFLQPSGYVCSFCKWIIKSSIKYFFWFHVAVGGF